MEKKNSVQEIIAKRVAQEFKDGAVVNLGIGIPTLVPNYLAKDVNVCVTSENGMIRVGATPPKGQEDKNLVNAGAGFVSQLPGSCYIDSALSFGIIRGGHLDITVLGALQVDSEGSIANWIIPGKLVPGMGGAMDLCTGAKQVIAALQHTDKDGNSKILKKCTLPLTAYKRVSLIVTDFAVIKVTDKGLVLKEIFKGMTVENVKKATDADLIIEKDIKFFGD